MSRLPAPLPHRVAAITPRRFVHLAAPLVALTLCFVTWAVALEQLIYFMGGCF